MASAGVFGALLLFGFRFGARRGRELQHRCLLAFFELRQQNLLAVRHFQDIVMDMWLVLVALPEDRSGELAFAEAVGGPAQLDWLFEGKLGAGQDTNRRGIADRIVNAFESNRATSEIVAYQLVGDGGGTRLGMLQAEVAHDQTSWFGCGRPANRLLRRRQRIAIEVNDTPDSAFAADHFFSWVLRRGAARGGGRDFAVISCD